MNKAILFLFCVAISQLGIAQTNYYVSPTGNNSNDGNLSNPWLEMQYAANQLAAGDTLNVMAGTYLGKININNSGSAGQDIVIRNHANDIAIINGATLANYEYLLKIQGKSHIKISGLKFRDYQKLDAIGITVINSSYISILNNEFSNIDYSPTALGQSPNSSKNSQPIIVEGRSVTMPSTNILIKGNSIHDCEVGWSECLSINGNVDGFEISDNHVYDNTNIAIDAIGFEDVCSNPAFDQARNGLIKNNLVHDNPSAYDVAAGLYVDGGKDIIIENNISYNNDYGLEIGCENNGGVANNPSSSGVIARNNLLYNNRLAGIVLGGYDYPSTGKVEMATITNNTCYHNDTDETYTGEITLTYIENSTIENNIFYTKNSETVLMTTSEAIPTVTLDYNTYYVPSGANDLVIEVNNSGYYEFSTYQNNTSKDEHSIFANPQFENENLANINLHLQDNSPAINAGNPVFQADANETDIDGQNRIIDNRVDCGADEFGVFVPEEGVEVSLQVFLEGAYTFNGQMQSQMSSIAPLSQPFSVAPWNYNGMESLTNFPSNFIDWILIEARDVNDANIVVSQKAALLLADGNITDVNNAYNGVFFTDLDENESYFFAIKARQHLAILSATAFNPTLVGTYSFANPANVMNGWTQLTDVGNGYAAMLAGDLNNDGLITVSDFNGYLLQTGSINQYISADFTLDAVVTIADFNLYILRSSAIGVSYIRY
ncbi:MAG: choice-of-anchor Q domain-containing protein [Chitinophagales bacterium]